MVINRIIKLWKIRSIVLIGEYIRMLMPLILIQLELTFKVKGYNQHGLKLFTDSMLTFKQLK